MRHALLILAGMSGIGATWATQFILRRKLFGMIVQNGLAGLAVIITFVIVAYLSVIWDQP